MDRREFLNAGMASTALAAAATITRAELMVESGSAHVKDRLGPKLDELEARFDKLEHHHKNVIRAGALAFTLSTGIDVLTLI